MIAEQVRSALEAPGSLLDPELAGLLAKVGWRRLAAGGIRPEDYSTARVLSCDAPRSRSIVGSVPPCCGIAPATIETFPNGLPSRYSELGMVEALPPPARIEAALAEALRELAHSGTAPIVVSTLVRSIHPLRSADPDYDVSYSDPEVPFSVFIGLHAAEVRHESLRIAEAILHETMHLQLSLAEDVVPLVNGESERWSSPWQHRPRPAQGVLHGLYVFRAVQEFLACLPESHDPVREDYVRRRLATIETEAREAASVAASADLTDSGRALAARLAATGPRRGQRAQFENPLVRLPNP